MPQSIADLIRQLGKTVGIDDAQIESLLVALGTDLAFDESVTYHGVQEIAAAVRQLATDEEAELAVIEQMQADLASLGAQVTALQEDTDSSFAATRADIASLRADVDAGISAILAALEGPPVPVATQAVITISTQSGGTMAGPSISIDDTTGAASVTWEDDHGDTDAAAPTGNDGLPVVVTFGTDNAGVATIDPASGVLSPVAEGTANVTIAATNATDGTPANFADGQPITATPAPFSIVAGPAASLVVNVAP